jgi:integrase
MLRQAAAEAGVPGMTPRSLRHSLATHLAGWWGLSSRQVRLVLRHTTEFTQAYYVHPDLANLRESMAGFDYQAASSPLPSPTTPRIAG